MDIPWILQVNLTLFVKMISLMRSYITHNTLAQHTLVTIQYTECSVYFISYYSVYYDTLSIHTINTSLCIPSYLPHPSSPPVNMHVKFKTWTSHSHPQSNLQQMTIKSLKSLAFCARFKKASPAGLAFLHFLYDIWSGCTIRFKSQDWKEIEGSSFFRGVCDSILHCNKWVANNVLTSLPW